MKQNLWLLSIGLAAVMHTAVAEPEAVSATVLLWQEQEAGIAPHSTRMLVTKQHLRSDDGRDAADFMLFNRQTRRIYSVSHSERSILVIEAEAMPATAGPQPAFNESLQPDPDAPRISGLAASQFQLSSGDQKCLQATLVPGLLPGVVDALGELQNVLAARQYRDLAKTAEEYRTPCFLANYVYAIDRHLQAGFPVMELRQDGWQRALLDYRSDQMIASELFQLPKGYREEHIP